MTPLVRAGVAVSGVGLAAGLGILVVGATTASRPLVYAHVVAAFGGVLLIGAHVWRVARSGATVSTARFSLVMIALVLAAAPWARSWHESAWRETYRVANPTETPLDMAEEGAGAASPFFPSSASTTSGEIIPANFFLTSEMCGRCHQDIYDQWNSSVHHFSSLQQPVVSQVDRVHAGRRWDPTVQVVCRLSRSRRLL